MFLPIAIVYRNGNRILRDQYRYLQNDVLECRDNGTAVLFLNVFLYIIIL